MMVLLLGLGIGFASFGHCATIQGRIHWTGNAGWRVTADFIYNSELPADDLGDDIAPKIESLSVEIHDPLGNLAAQYNNVVNGSPFYTYLYFYFDPASQQLVEGSSLDIGEDPGYWLSGTINEPYDFALVRDNYSGEAGDDAVIIVDLGGAPFITLVPEPSGGLLASLGVVLLLMRRR